MKALDLYEKWIDDYCMFNIPIDVSITLQRNGRIYIGISIGGKEDHHLRRLFTDAIYGIFDFPKGRTCSKEKWENKIVPAFFYNDFKEKGSAFQSQPSLYNRVNGYGGLRVLLRHIGYAAGCVKEATKEEMAVS